MTRNIDFFAFTVEELKIEKLARVLDEIKRLKRDIRNSFTKLAK